MNSTTISSIIILLIMLFLFSSFVLQILSYRNIQRHENANTKLSIAKRRVLYNMVVSLVGSMIGALVLVLFYRRSNKSKTPAMVNVSMYLLAMLLFISGSLAAMSASSLQCVKELNKDLNNAWLYSTACAIIGIIGTVMILILEGSKRINSYKESQNPQYNLNNKMNNKPMYDNENKMDNKRLFNI